jgi:hypothetical protein
MSLYRKDLIDYQGEHHQKSNPATAVRANAEAALMTALSVHILTVIPVPVKTVLTVVDDAAFCPGVGDS